MGYCTVYCATNPRIEDSFTYCVPLWSSNVNEWFLFNRHSLETPFIGVDYYHTLVIILIGYKRVNEPLCLLTLHTSTEINSEATKMTDCFISKLLKLCRFQFTCYFRIKIISHNYLSSELFSSLIANFKKLSLCPDKDLSLFSLRPLIDSSGCISSRHSTTTSLLHR